MIDYKIIAAIYGFIFGCILGSFLGLVLDRLPRGESIISPPSHCPKCNARLKWYDNIPVFGYIHLHGKCRNCGTQIPIRDFLVETGMGFAFAIVIFLVTFN
ncbi:MAG: prepilin peptidase [Candidatus Dojkabacteria bacterium]